MRILRWSSRSRGRWHLAASPRAASRRAAVAPRVAHEHQILADFERLVAMPNVATTLPDVEANAAYISGAVWKRAAFKPACCAPNPEPRRRCSPNA